MKLHTSYSYTFLHLIGVNVHILVNFIPIFYILRIILYTHGNDNILLNNNINNKLNNNIQKYFNILKQKIYCLN